MPRYTIADAQVDVTTYNSPGVRVNLGVPANNLPSYNNLGAAINGLCGHCSSEPHTERVLMSHGGSRLLCQWCSTQAQKQFGAVFMEEMRKWQLN